MKKLFSLLLIPIVLLATFSVPVHAQEEEEEMPKIPLEQGWKDMDDASDVIQNTPNGGQNADKLAGKSMYGTASVLLTALAPEILENSENLAEGPMKKGLLGVTEDGIVALFNNQPRIDVVAHLAEEWVPGYKDSNAVYANGYNDLQDSGISSLWSTTRNIAYAFYVVIMIIVGFMIMFRNKIGGQMMVTIGNSIPKIIISLVLVTFSFAIIGLIIDIAGVATNIIAAILYGDISKGVRITNPWVLFGSIFARSGTSIGMTATGTLGLAGAVIGIVKVGGLASIAGGPVFWIGAGLFLALLALILVGVILVGAIKLWIVLIKAYMGILINVVTAPLAIMVSAIPGNDAMMWNTFKSALRNALVFPLAFAIVNLPYHIQKRGISLTFPNTLSGNPPKNESTFISGMLIGIAKIVAIYAAASAPEIMKGVIPATASKSGVDVSKSLQEGMAKVPFIGGMFK